MFLARREDGRGRILGAVLSQAEGHSYPTLAIDVQVGTHIPNRLMGTKREIAQHGAMMKVYGDAVIPFMAQMLAAGLPVLLYPSNGGDEKEWLRYIQKDRTILDD